MLENMSLAKADTYFEQALHSSAFARQQVFLYFSSTIFKPQNEFAPRLSGSGW